MLVPTKKSFGAESSVVKGDSRSVAAILTVELRVDFATVPMADLPSVDSA